MSPPRSQIHFFNICVEICKEYAPILLKSGLAIQPPVLSVIIDDSDLYTSEVRIDIVHLKTHELADRLEFYVFERGKQRHTGEDIGAWLVEQLVAMAN